MEVFKEVVSSKPFMLIVNVVVSIIIMCSEFLHTSGYAISSYCEDIVFISEIFILCMCSFSINLYDEINYDVTEKAKVFLVKYFTGAIYVVVPYVALCSIAIFVLDIDTRNFILVSRMIVFLMFFYTYSFFVCFSEKHGFKKFILNIIAVVTPVMIYIITIKMMNENINDAFELDGFFEITETIFSFREINYNNILFLIISTIVMFIIQLYMYSYDYMDTKFASAVNAVKNIYIYLFLLSISAIIFYGRFCGRYNMNDIFGNEFIINVAIISLIIAFIYLIFKYIILKDDFKKLYAFLSIFAIFATTFLYYNSVYLDTFGIATYAPATSRIISAEIYDDVFFEKENIERIKNIQKMQFSNLQKSQNLPPDEDYIQLFSILTINYDTKFGDVERKYFSIDTVEMYEALKELYSDEEYKNNFINKLESIRPVVTQCIVKVYGDEGVITLKGSDFIDLYIKDVKEDDDFSRYSYGPRKMGDVIFAADRMPLLKEGLDRNLIYIKASYKNCMNYLIENYDSLKNKKIVVYKNPLDDVKTQEAFNSGKKYLSYRSDLVIEDSNYDKFIEKLEGGEYEDVYILDYNTEPEKYMDFIEKTKFDTSVEDYIIEIDKDTDIYRAVFVNEKSKTFYGIPYKK